MGQPFLGPEAVRAQRLTRGQLRWNHTAVHPRVYLANDAEQTLYVSTVAAWLWTGRRGVIAGRAAAALLEAKWVDPSTPIDVIAEHTRRRDGVAVHDMGYDEPMVGLDYEGAHHSQNRGQYVCDIGRADLFDREGWFDIRVVKEHSRRFVLHRVREAFSRRRWTPPNSA
jgi:hypothetical protein